MEPSYIELLEEYTRLQNEIDELKEYSNKETSFDLEKINEIIKTEISEHIKKCLNFDLNLINEMIRSEISQHITAQLANVSSEQNDKNNTKNDIKDNINENISTYNINKNMFFDIKLTNQDKKKNDNNNKKDNIKAKDNINTKDNIKANIQKENAIVPICNLKLVNDIIKEENLDLCVISHGGCCSNQLVDVLTDNGYNVKTPIWKKILCHCPDYIDIDIPIIYMYGNPMTSFLSVKNRGNGHWNINQQKLSNNENTKLSDENLLILMLKQINTWININKPNVLILKSSEIFEESILDKLQTFLKKELYSFPIKYIKPQTTLENLDRDILMLFQKYKKNINTIIKKYLYDL